ncbi:protein TBF1 [Rhizophagus clarus]|uniref:Protein TBF1 n=1 Tax=Rhizophagus clarus TaxID=94130 RepID=A0A8H3M6B1_9GLOM|nr:protein TBF1 [Rhizophagus clarus]
MSTFMYKNDDKLEGIMSSIILIDDIVKSYCQSCNENLTLYRFNETMSFESCRTKLYKINNFNHCFITSIVKSIGGYMNMNWLKKKSIFLNYYVHDGVYSYDDDFMRMNSKERVFVSNLGLLMPFIIKNEKLQRLFCFFPFIIYVMTSKPSGSIIGTAIISKDDELLRYLHILDTLAYDSLTAQLKYFEKEIRNQAPSVIKNLKWIASKKYMCFYEILNLSLIMSRGRVNERIQMGKHTSEEVSYLSSTSSNNIVVEDSSRKEIDGNTKKRRLADAEGEEDILPDNLGDSFTRREEIIQKMSLVDINGSQSVECIQSDSLLNSDGESHTSILSPRTTRRERDNKANSSKRRATIPMRKTIERSSSSLTNMIVDLTEPVDDRQISVESFTERSPSVEEIEDNSREKNGKKRELDNSDHVDNEEAKRMMKRIKNMWTDEELRALEEGMRHYGKQWTTIKKIYGEEGQALENRTAIQLKDKARCEFNRRKRYCIDTGVFAIVEHS